MSKEIRYSDKAAKQLRKIIKSDKKSAGMILKAIEKYAADPSLNHDVKVLKGRFEDLKRLRVGNYRIIFDEEMHVINIYEVKHLQEAYND